ncbi:MAG: AAA family ATPase [Oscillospiraceae bacterium]|nr:AAA family ATPase [Oscillospiraceae bacterium]
MQGQQELKLIHMSEVEATKINWLWYPYIPFGKITMVQGDPGDGKTTTVLAVAAAVTMGSALPESKATAEPMSVIFQTAEDGLGDTVKPRLVRSGADCGRVIVIDESEKELSLSDARIEQAIAQTGARLFILDPLQAYLGADVDMHRANEIRPVLKRIGAIAEKTGCAVVVVGHLNKGTSKSQYRGLGSIDIQAAARSVLTVGRVKGNPYLRAIAQGKNNLAPEGKTIGFELDPDTGFRWAGVLELTIDELLSGSMPERDTTYDRAVSFLKSELADGEQLAAVLFEKAAGMDIQERTVRKAKQALGISSFKKDKRWLWKLPKGENTDE